MTHLPRNQEWTALALCAQTDPDAFFPEKGGSTAAAKAFCAKCPVRRQCLDYALAYESGSMDTHTSYPSGIFGGLSERERRALRKQQPDLAATGTDTPTAAVDEQDRPAPRSYGGTYVAGTGARPIPLATDITTRRPHTPRKPRPTGLDWSKHRAPEPEQTPAPVQLRCRWCRQPATDLEHDLCARCRDDATQRFQTPDTTALGRDLAHLERTDPEVAAAAAAYDDMVQRVTRPDDHIKLPAEDNQGQPTTGSSAPGATSTSSTTGRAPVAGPSTTRGKDPEPAQETRPVPAPAPADVVDTVWQQLHATRATLAAELARIDQTLALLDPLTTPPAPVAATSTPEPIAATDPNHRRSHPLARRTRANAAEIRRRYVDDQQSIPEIARALDHSTSTVRRALTDAGVLLRDDRATRSGGRNQIKAYPDQLVADVRRLYLDEHLSQQQVAARVGVSTKVVQTLMARHDIPARPSATAQPRPQAKKLDDPALLEQLVARYQAGESANALAKAYDVSQPTVLARLRDRGVTIRGRGGSRGGAAT